jgi:hypothetical protein
MRAPMQLLLHRQSEPPDKPERKLMFICNVPVVLETPTFHVAPCLDCDIAAYLVVIPRITASLICELPDLAKHELGPLLGRLESAVLAATGAEHVYVLRFSEARHHAFPHVSKNQRAWPTLETTLGGSF